MSDNLKLWESVQQTNPKYTKEISGKQFNGTSINPMYLTRKATEQFGPMGKGWGVDSLETVTQQIGETTLYSEHVQLWYMQGEERCSVSQWASVKVAYLTSKGKLLVDDEARKKCRTNATSKCLSLLGFSADIWLQYYNSSAYIQQMETEHKAEDKAEQNAAVFRELLSILKNYCSCKTEDDQISVCRWAIEDDSIDLGMLRVAPQITEQIKTALREKIKAGIEPHTILHQANEWKEASK